MKIANYVLKNNTILAPMAGVTDRPFRTLCAKLGAGMVVSEMVGANSLIQDSAKTLRRAAHNLEIEPRSVQIVGCDPKTLATAAKINADNGAEIIDINMGCPAKKICQVLAGSALLRDEQLVEQILTQVVKAVNIPVTLKIRTGWCVNSRNGVQIAKIAEGAGIQALAVHGRTRSCFFTGQAEYDTIKAIKAAVKIPIIANGDITSPQQAKYVLNYTNADAVMIGRAAQGNPWIFREITHYLHHGSLFPPPEKCEILTVLLGHIEALYDFYGQDLGVKIARKHISWYSKGQKDSAAFRAKFNTIDTAYEQIAAIQAFFEI